VQQLTARELELQTELESIKNKNLELEARIAESAPRLEEIEAERKESEFNTKLSRMVAELGLERGLSLTERAFLGILKRDLKLEVSTDGTIYPVSDAGHPLNFEAVLRSYAEKNAYMFEGRSVDRLKKHASELYRSEMSDAQKSAYISKHGADAYQRLPVMPKPRISLSTINAEEYRKLPSSEKIRIINQVGEAGVSEILKRK